MVNINKETKKQISQWSFLWKQIVADLQPVITSRTFRISGNLKFL